MSQFEAMFSQAMQVHGEGRLDEAVHAYQQLLSIAPGNYAVLNNLAAALIALDRLDDASHYLQQALVIAPDFVPALVNVAKVQQARGQLDAAAASLTRALQLEPGRFSAHLNLGNVWRALGKPLDALPHYQQALAIGPANAGVYNNLGLALLELAQTDDAIACFLQAMRYAPNIAEPYSNLGIALLQQGKLSIALDALREAVAVDPGFASGHLNLGAALREHGDIDQAAACYRAALDAQPGWLKAQAALLFLLSSDGASTEPAYLAALAQFGAELDRHVNGRGFRCWHHRQAGARLKLGLVSGDLRAHPVAYFLESCLPHLAALDVEITLYSTDYFEDAVSARLQSLCHRWRVLCHLDDEAAAHCIHDDQIDVLMDLSGHTDKSRLAIFGWRPAPVQVSWLGYFASTGVRQMDAIVVDPAGIGPGQQAAFTEQLLYLPETRLCFSAPDPAPVVAPLPALARGYLTFGCFQNLSKVSDSQLALWARVLDAVPSAQLRWQCKQFADPDYVNHTAHRLAACGIGLDRVQLFGQVEREAYLAAHGEVDILLDTSPYPGGTTTCEALWMGVPTVTLAGTSLLARQGASLLTAAGLADWVCTDQDAYIAKAVAAASDLPALARLRTGLRAQLAASPLCDARRFAAHLHAGLLALSAKAGAGRVPSPSAFMPN